MTEKHCGTCKWFALERGKERSGACLFEAVQMMNGKWRYECVCSNTEACCYHEERTDSPEKLIRDMLMVIYSEAPYWEECKHRARELGIEV